MSNRWRGYLIGLLTVCMGVLVYAGLTVHRPLLGLLFLGLAFTLWVPMALLVPDAGLSPGPDD